MKYIVYLTRNNNEKINGINRIYIGVHETKNPEIFDGYLGCGVYINQPSTYKYPKTPFQCAVKKYGVSSFTRQTLFIFDNEDEAYKKEAEIVDINFLKQDYTYNACLGGKHYYNYKKLYQFDLQGNLVKEWKYSKEAYTFYNLPIEKFEYAIHNKHPLIDSLWSSSSEINITEYSTKPLSDIFRYKLGWYKDYYISLEKIETLPEKGNRQSVKVDVYDKYGNFIETLNSIKLVKEKYNIPSSKIKNLELGDRYFGDFIFKYHSKISK